jgi:hypothetical protein
LALAKRAYRLQQGAPGIGRQFDQLSDKFHEFSIGCYFPHQVDEAKHL